MNVLLLKIPTSAIEGPYFSQEYLFVDRLTQGFLRRGQGESFVQVNQLIWMRSLAKPFDQILVFCGEEWPTKASFKWLEIFQSAKLWASGSFSESELKSLEKKYELGRLATKSFDLNSEPLCEL